jgi:hypothetical protein
MESSTKKGSNLTPEVQFDPKSGKISIKGKAIPTSEADFFHELMKWLDGYVQNPNDNTSLEIDLQYMNGKTVRSLLQILKQFEKLSASGKSVNVDWSVPADAEDIADLKQHLLSGIQSQKDIQAN